jgi:tubulin polyglutamylase TTLL6/13
MHLTNYAINKTNQNFVYNESDEQMDTGHKRSFTSVIKTLKERGYNTDELWNRIKDMIIKTFISAQPVLSHHYKSCQPDNHANNMCFEILGLDIMLDDTFKPYLLEVNYTPSFSTDTPLDKLIKKNVIKDSL